MSAPYPHHTNSRLHLRLVGVVVIIIGALCFIPLGRAPSVAGWAQAYIRGKGKPHFVIEGTRASRIEDFFDRYPPLRPEWEEVPDMDNGYLQMRKFVKEQTATDLVLNENLLAMLQENGIWTQNAAKEYVEKNAEGLKELHRIALLSDRSSKGKSTKKAVEPSHYLQMADVLHLSFRYHLHAKQYAEALADFSALYGLAGHIDRHEVPRFENQSLAIQIRITPHSALRKYLQDMPTDTDWSPWMRVLQNEPSYGKQMEAIWRGEAWAGIQTILDSSMGENQINPIWDFTDMEDAYATRILKNSKAYANASKLKDVDGLKKLESDLKKQEAPLSKPARAVLEEVQSSSYSWVTQAIRGEAECNLTLAALQFLQSEQMEEGPIRSDKDIRMGSLAIDPSNGMPFVYDPAVRQLAPAAGSILAGREPVQLPRW